MIIKHWAFWLIFTSPVIIPTSLNFFLKSQYFWLLRAFIGEVYITFLLFCLPKAIPYSATKVFPLDVWAHTSIFFFCSKRIILRFWNVSKVNLNSIAGFLILSNSDISISSSIAKLSPGFFSVSILIILLSKFDILSLFFIKFPSSLS